MKWEWGKKRKDKRFGWDNIFHISFSNTTKIQNKINHKFICFKIGAWIKKSFK